MYLMIPILKKLAKASTNFDPSVPIAPTEY